MTYRVKVYKDAEQDNYDHGCTGELMSFGCIMTEEIETPEKIIDFCKQFGNTPMIFEDHISVDQMENGEGYEATESEIEAWKEGKKKLWLVRYDVRISEFKEIDLQNKKLKKIFPRMQEY